MTLRARFLLLLGLVVLSWAAVPFGLALTWVAVRSADLLFETLRRTLVRRSGTGLATVALAARYQALVAVVLGTTLGMMLANAPAVWLGERLAHRVNMKYLRWAAAALFFLLGGLALVDWRG